MRTSRMIMWLVVLVCWLLSSNTYATERESIHDRKSNLQPDVVLDIPNVSTLCETLALNGRRIGLGDCRLFYEMEGSGPPLILLHGGPGCTHHIFHPHFTAASKFATVIYYDQRGCGMSDYNRGQGYTIVQAANDLDALRVALKIDRWVVLGHSYGGTLAQCYASLYPEYVAGLVLVCSATYGLPGIPDGGWRQDRFLSDEEIARINEIYNMDLSAEQQLYNAHLNGDWKRQNYYRPSPEALARMARYEWKHDSAFRSEIFDSIWLLDFQDVFTRCPLPVLIMEGQWDMTYDEGKAAKIHKSFPGSEYALFQHSAHSPFEDETELFFERLRRFMSAMPDVSEERLADWKTELAQIEAKRVKSPKYILAVHGYGIASSKKIAELYSEEWIDLLEPGDILRLGMVLYDVERYEDALRVLQKEPEEARPKDIARIRIWRGFVLDLLDRRADAVAAYKTVAAMEIMDGVTHSQYDMSYRESAYAAALVHEPFKRIENTWPE